MIRGLFWPGAIDCFEEKGWKKGDFWIWMWMDLDILEILIIIVPIESNINTSESYEKVASYLILPKFRPFYYGTK